MKNLEKDNYRRKFLQKTTAAAAIIILSGFAFRGKDNLTNRLRQKQKN